MKISKTFLFSLLIITTSTYTADADGLELPFAGMQVAHISIATLCDGMGKMQVEEHKVSLEQVQSEVKGVAIAPWDLVISSFLEQIDAQNEQEGELTAIRFRDKVVLPTLETLEMGLVTRSLQCDFNMLNRLYTNTCKFLEWGFKELCNSDLPQSSDTNRYDVARVIKIQQIINQQLKQKKADSNEMDCE